MNYDYDCDYVIFLQDLMSRGVSSKGSVPSDYEFSMYHVYWTTLRYVEKAWLSKFKLDLLVYLMIVLIILIQ